MQIRDILVPLPRRLNGQLDHGARYAIGLARAHACAITGLAYEIAAAPWSIDEPAATPAQAGEEEVRRATQLCEAFAAEAAAAQVTFTAVRERSYAFGMAEVFADYARVRDLAILGVSGRISQDNQLLVQAALFGSGRPLILVPETGAGFAQERIVLAWDATPAIVHAISGSMPVLRAAREVVVVSVTDDKPFRPGQSGVELCRYLARHDVRATFEAIQRRERPVGTVILEAAQANAADLLVMGGYAHSSLRGLMFGSATRDVFDRPLPLPILIAH